MFSSSIPVPLLRKRPRRPLKRFFISPVSREKAAAVFSLCLDVFLNDMGKFWKRNCQRWTSSSGPELSNTFPNCFLGSRGERVSFRNPLFFTTKGHLEFFPRLLPLPT